MLVALPSGPLLPMIKFELSTSLFFPPTLGMWTWWSSSLSTSGHISSPRFSLHAMKIFLVNTWPLMELNTNTWRVFSSWPPVKFFQSENTANSAQQLEGKLMNLLSGIYCPLQNTVKAFMGTQVNTLVLNKSLHWYLFLSIFILWKQFSSPLFNRVEHNWLTHTYLLMTFTGQFSS